ncbi:hypothetical protein B0H94_102271 [Salsuginibacillus halophilus]|uniref:CAAX prenyl protease 2/Lysostaphin resistance protein A-like domain-containing protein n=1 Tax=Salsuginibacillus halophilus TaxID=517424 RepID=A0A2P8HXV6_9BACI|nr:type II CAAX endopeptidase family protein [Salsuginibacillus halophilus]PSL50994.1 hypothetical protein B0H94_102271 [Salsuginibacillus halophilus]
MTTHHEDEESPKPPDVPLRAVWYSFGFFFIIGLLFMLLIHQGDVLLYIRGWFSLGTALSETAAGAGIGLIAAVVAYGLQRLFAIEFPDNEQTRILISLMHKRGGIATIAFGPGITEEILFRGMLLGSLLFVLPAWAALGISSLLFFMLHIPQYKGSLWMHASVLCMGFLLGLLFLWTENLWMPIAAHVVYNGSVALLLLKKLNTDLEV